MKQSLFDPIATGSQVSYMLGYAQGWMRASTAPRVNAATSAIEPTTEDDYFPINQQGIPSSTLAMSVVQSAPTIPIGRAKSVDVPPGAYSPAYLAARRREKCLRIRGAIVGLQSWAQHPDFHIWTQEPVSMVRKLIHFLDNAEEFAEVEHEGNTCEVLRQVRDTFLRGGWEQYRNEEVRKRVAEIIRHLATTENVSAQFADESMDVLLDLGLEPAVSHPLEDGQEAQVTG